MSSYKKINYNLRMAKTVERKMFIEAFRKLSVFQKIEKYRYVGFGSTYFNDFILYHKSLGLNNMVSIEKEINESDRFTFNKPYSCIKLNFGTSTLVLPTLSWDEKTILWLDYDNDLNDSILSDINSFVASAKSGSMLILTIKAHPCLINTNDEKERQEKRLLDIQKRIAQEKIPPTLTGKNLNLYSLHKVYRNIIFNEIESCLLQRNGLLSEENKFRANQIFNILYQDGARMLTLGFVLYSKMDDTKMNDASFEDLNFFSNTEKTFNIEIPNLTLKELKFLDSLLPNNIHLDTGKLKKRKRNIALLPAEDIIKAQRKEIAEMEAAIERLEK